MTSFSLSVEDFKDDFLLQRPSFLKEILALKKRRRLILTENISLLFENKRLVWWQIQEMLRIEKGGILQLEEEIKVYRPLLPTPQRLTATLMLEFPPHLRGGALTRLVGIEHSLILAFDHATSTSFSLMGQVTTPQKTTSLHFIGFDLSPLQKKAFCTSYCNPTLTIDHPQCSESIVLSKLLWSELVATLEGSDEDISKS